MRATVGIVVSPGKARIFALIVAWHDSAAKSPAFRAVERDFLFHSPFGCGLEIHGLLGRVEVHRACGAE